MLEEVKESRYPTDCVPAGAPSLGGDTARRCADCGSGRAAGKPGWTEPTTELSHTTETPEDTARGLIQLRATLTQGKHWNEPSSSVYTQ